MSRIRPVYVDGPLEGREFDSDSAFVQAIDTVAYEDSAGSPFLHGNTVTYQFRQFAFHMGGKAVRWWIGWCSPGEPDAEAVAKALFKPDVMERAEAYDMPEDLSLLEDWRPHRKREMS